MSSTKEELIEKYQKPASDAMGRNDWDALKQIVADSLERSHSRPDRLAHDYPPDLVAQGIYIGFQKLVYDTRFRQAEKFLKLVFPGIRSQLDEVGAEILPAVPIGVRNVDALIYVRAAIDACHGQRNKDNRRAIAKALYTWLIDGNHKGWEDREFNLRDVFLVFWGDIFSRDSYYEQQTVREGWSL